MADRNAGLACDLSVALLTRNAGDLLERLLESVRGQVTDLSVEVIAIDSGSTDGTVATLESYGAEVTHLSPEKFDFGRTRDLAYQRTHGKIVVNLSQDAIPAHPRWLENLVRPLADPDVAVSCGKSVPDPDRAQAQFPWERNGYFYFTREIRKFVRAYGRGVSFSNSAVRRSVWERLRFDPQPLGEDFQFQKKVHAANLKMAFPDDAEVLHHHNYDLRGLYGRCRNEGLALRMMGCGYSEWDLLRDLGSPRKYVQWLRELKRGTLHSSAAIGFPVVRPVAVYMGSRFGKSYRAYEHSLREA
jgi:rhamnosyltransferase